MSAIIAKAVNSTLGTNNFKAFDELLKDTLRTKSIIAYDSEGEAVKNPLYRYPISPSLGNNESYTLPMTLEFNNWGSFNITWRYISNGSSSTSVKVFVVKNGIDANIYSGGETNGDIRTESKVIDFAPGDIITFKFSVSNGTVSFDNITIHGNIVDHSPFTISAT